jgi:hypothetical protein
MRSFISCALHQILLRGNFKEDEMGGASGSMGEMRHAYNILVGKPEWKNYSEDLGVDGRILL